MNESDELKKESLTRNEANRLLKVAIYVRKSNATEGRSKSLVEQHQACLDAAAYFCFDTNNLTLYEESEGCKGEWGWQGHPSVNGNHWRPALTRLVNDIHAGKVDAVMVWKTDRLYRDAGLCDALMKLFKSKGVHFVVNGRDMDIDSAAGYYQASVDAASNRRQRDTTSEDIKRTQLFRATRGLFSRNPSCLGFRSNGSQQVIPNWEELALVNRIFTLFVQGEGDKGPLGMNAIASLLMEEGIPIARGAKGHKSKNPQFVSTSQIKIILKNCMYIGIWRHAGKEYKNERLLLPASDGSGALTTVVPLTLFEAAQEKLARQDRPGKRSLSSEHLLSGLIVCSFCGMPSHVNVRRFPDEKGGERRAPRYSYRCDKRRSAGRCRPLETRTIQEPVLDEWVITELAPLIAFEIEQMRTAAGREADQTALVELERQLAQARKRESEKLTRLMDGLDKEQFAMVAAQLRSEREQLQRKIEEVNSRLNNDLQMMPDLSTKALKDMPPSALKEALSRAVQWIAVSKEGLTVLTSWGTYFGATFQERDEHTYYTSETRTQINAPTPLSALLCPRWLPSPEDFVKGRRHALGKRAENLSDEEILPGFIGNDAQAYVMEIENEEELPKEA
jgi:site-specific DNA recombinase